MLEGVKILSFTHYLQGPSCAQALADLGADVVKVESVKGAYERGWSGCNTYKEGVSVFFLMANRNQRGIALNLKTKEGKTVIYKLIKEQGYDVIIENFRPGVMDKLGLGYDKLKELSQRIIYCSCTGYGSSGPKAEKPGQDLLLQGASGLISLTGIKGRPPIPVGTAVVDQHGAILAALGITAAVYDREKTGKGHRIETSLLNSALDLQIEPLNYYINGGELISFTDTGLSTRFHQSPYGVYSTLDGYITLSLTSFDKLLKAFSPGALDKFKPDDQMKNRVEFDKTVHDEMLKHTTQEWIEIFDKLGIWYTPVYEYDDVLKDEQVIYNKTFFKMNHPVAGDVTILGHANRYDGEPVAMRRFPPELGEHTEEILKECGYSNEHINELAKNGVIRI